MFEKVNPGHPDKMADRLAGDELVAVRRIDVDIDLDNHSLKRHQETALLTRLYMSVKVVEKQPLNNTKGYPHL